MDKEGVAVDKDPQQDGHLPLMDICCDETMEEEETDFGVNTNPGSQIKILKWRVNIGKSRDMRHRIQWEPAAVFASSGLIENTG